MLKLIDILPQRERLHPHMGKTVRQLVDEYNETNRRLLEHDRMVARNIRDARLWRLKRGEKV